MFPVAAEKVLSYCEALKVQTLGFGLFYRLKEN